MLYFDNNASTHTDPDIANKINDIIKKTTIGNPSSNHAHGWNAHAIYVDCKNRISSIYNSLPDDIIFTSGATESNNLAVGGIIQAAHIKNSKRKNIIVSAIEHKCVLNTAKYFCELLNFNLIVNPVLPNGIIDLNFLELMVNDATLLVSVMTTNNETGTIQPIKEIGLLCKKHGVIFHTDMAQAFYNEIDMVACGIDMISLSGHKIYAPAGIGALIIDSEINLKPQPILHGGLQQDNYRSGSIPVHLCYALCLAIEKIHELKNSERSFLYELRSYFLKQLSSLDTEFIINGDMEARHPGNLNLSFKHTNNDLLIQQLQPHASLSTGSACNAGTIQNSYVLQAMGLEDWRLKSAIRLCFGRFSTFGEVDILIEKLVESLEKIRNIT